MPYVVQLLLLVEGILEGYRFVVRCVRGVCLLGGGDHFGQRLRDEVATTFEFFELLVYLETLLGFSLLGLPGEIGVVLFEEILLIL